MDVTPLIKEGIKVVQDVSDDRIVISGTEHTSSVILRPREVLAVNEPTAPSNLTESVLEPFIEHSDDIDLVLLGTGSAHVFVPPKTLKPLRDKDIAVEVMDTAAAARTYNVLVAEGRRVAALLLI